MDVPTNSPSLIELIEQIETALPADRSLQATEIIRLLCKFVPPEARRDVLATLPDTVATRPEMMFGPAHPIPATDPGASIVKQCDEFIRRLEDGQYFERMAYDEERHEERAFGDETWAREMDELFARAATAYLSESYALAARIYGRLLTVFRHSNRIGVFCGGHPPEDMVETDTDEAKRRYLRSTNHH